MYRATAALASTLLLLLLVSAPSADPASGTGEPVPSAVGAVEAAPSPEGTSPERTLYGPIRAKDPAVRAQIKRLYLERNRLEDASRIELAGLAGQLRAEADPDFRWEIHQQIVGVKLELRLRTMELGLEIARLNGDEPRATEYELALDQLRHPEKYRPAPADPAIQLEKMRSQGLEARDAR